MLTETEDGVIAKISKHVSRDEYKKINERVKSYGGIYSRDRGGFVFNGNDGINKLKESFNIIDHRTSEVKDDVVRDKILEEPSDFDIARTESEAIPATDGIEEAGQDDIGTRGNDVREIPVHGGLDGQTQAGDGNVQDREPDTAANDEREPSKRVGREGDSTGGTEEPSRVATAKPGAISPRQMEIGETVVIQKLSTLIKHAKTRNGKEFISTVINRRAENINDIISIDVKRISAKKYQAVGFDDETGYNDLTDDASSKIIFEPSWYDISVFKVADSYANSDMFGLVKQSAIQEEINDGLYDIYDDTGRKYSPEELDGLYNKQGTVAETGADNKEQPIDKPGDSAPVSTDDNIPDEAIRVAEPAETIIETPQSANAEEPATDKKDDVKLNRNNYRAEPSDIDDKAPSYSDNIEAIKTLKIIESENRAATSEEQSSLAKYKGWGGLARSFADYTTIRELSNILTPAEYKDARATVNNAHYTSAKIIGYIYDALKRMGYKSGSFSNRQWASVIFLD